MQRYTREYEDMVYDDEGDFVLYDEAQAVIAAKDAEIQKANYLLTRREKLIKKLGKKVQRLESANAALRELLGECYDDGLESHELRDRIDAALKEAGVSDV